MNSVLARRRRIRGDGHMVVLVPGFMGAVEGMLRDHMLARTSHFPASYAESGIRNIVSNFLSPCMTA
jgi:hypothetical protein